MLKGLLISAQQLTLLQKKEIEARFSDIHGEEVSLDLHIDESLIGGIIVGVGGRVYDGSVKARLSEVSKALMPDGGDAADV